MYNNYYNYVESIVQNDDLSSFKSNPNYNAILEHVSKNIGEEYMILIQKEFNLSDEEIFDFCRLNDKIGNPNLSQISGLKVSPSSLRYIYHSLLILSHIKNLGLQNVNIVEIGGGYGGLLLAISHFNNKFKFTNIGCYNIIDLEPIIKLQEKYFINFKLSFRFKLHNAFTYGSEISEENLFLISNYCFSEIDKLHQEKYIKTLFNKTEHGFLTWNFIEYYDFGKKVEMEKEKPLTSKENYFIKF